MPRRAIPPGPPPRPFVGNLIELTRDPLGFMTACAHTYGDISSYHVVHITSFLLNHPDHIQAVLVDHNRDFAKGRLLNANRLLLGNGLATSEGEFWRGQRRLIQLAFHRQRIAAYGAVMVAYAERLAATWQDSETLDLHDEMNRLAQQIAARTLFDSDIDDTQEVGRAFKVCLEQFQARSRTAFLLPTEIPTPGNLRLNRAVRQLDGVIYRLIAARRAQGEDRGDLLSMLLAARDGDGQPLSDRQLRDEVMTIFLAGHDPVGVGLTWTGYLLATHPAVETRLLAELDTVLAGRVPGVEDLPRLPYTRMVIQEALRLYPPIWGVVRRAVRDCEVGGYTLRAGDSAAMSQWIMHRDPRYYDTPDAFRPERWAEPRMQALPRFAYFPFGGGPRICIGDAFAMQELCLVTATLVPRFHLSLVEPGPVELLPSITLRPKNGLRVRVTTRRSAADSNRRLKKV
ncbi:MAG: cytochrome P450 [Anaerolineae bacterium]